MCACFSVASYGGRFAGRHGHRIHGNRQLAPVQTADELGWYPVTARLRVVVRHRDDREWPQLDSGGQRVGRNTDGRRCLLVPRRAPNPGRDVSV